MLYSSFSLATVKDTFNLTLKEGDHLFTKVPLITPSANLQLCESEQVCTA